MTISPQHAQQIAANATRDALHAHWRGDELVVLDAACGAGKSTTLRHLAAQAYGLGQRALVGCQTNEQTVDLGVRLADVYPGLPVHLFVRRDLALPERLPANLTVVKEAKKLPRGQEPCVVVANLAKTSYLWLSRIERDFFDIAFIDEAYQATYAAFSLVRDMAARIFMVGDCGQIDPFSTAKVERWAGQADAPHVSAPRGLMQTAAAAGLPVTRLSMPVSRRIPHSSVAPVDAFYDDLDLASVAAPGERALHLDGPQRADRLDAALDLVCGGQESLSMLELPARLGAGNDIELCEQIAALVGRLRERNAFCTDASGFQEGPVDASQVGVVVAHRQEVARLQGMLATVWPGVLVETANRFQGLERQVIIAAHPLSGLAQSDTFHSDAGRLCVAISRHRVACVLVGRAGISKALARTPYQGDRDARELQDVEWQGRKAHLTLLGHLANGRTVSA